MAATRVLVVGAGPAGLAAAVRVLEQGGRDRFRVRLANLGHHLGGRASSWRDEQGRLVDHGLHVTVGFYREMKGLLRRAGVDVEARLCSNEGHTYIYEPRDGQVHDLHLKTNPLEILFSAAVYSGFSAREKAAMTRFTLANLGAFAGAGDLERFDDVCFTTWCLENGLPPEVVRTSAFRLARTAQLTWPNEISAYSMLKAVRVIGRDYRSSEYGFCDGGMSERFWEPLLAYFARLGGEYEMMKQLVGLRWSGRRLTGARFREPDPAGHDLPSHPPGASPFEGEVPGRPGTEQLDEDFDWLISTIPWEPFKRLNPGDAAFWSLPMFAALRKLRGIRPLALQIWHREELSRRWQSVIGGIDGPFGYVLDTKHVIREYRENPRYGAVLYFVGQETGYERQADEQLLELALATLTRLPGFERLGRAGVIDYRVVRGRADHQLYHNAEPGILRFRPTMRTPLENLLLAGDWVRNELDFPCMEAAVRSGLAAADAVVQAA